MSAQVETPLPRAAWEEAVEAACARIAPTWPLDRFIAVNPYWGFVHLPIERAMAELGATVGTRGVMPRAFYREAWQKGDIQRHHLVDVLAEHGAGDTPDALISALDQPDLRPAPPPLLSDVADARRDLSRNLSWRDVITHQVSQFCAAAFDADQAHWHPDLAQGLYASWRARMADDHSVPFLTGERGLAERTRRLPAAPDAMLAYGLAHLGVPAGALTEYLTTVLASVNGWAAWCAYLRWDARLAGTDDTHIVDLLAVRLAWECLVDNGERGPESAHAAWARNWERVPEVTAEWEDRARVDWIWQRALEVAYARPLSAALARVGLSPTAGVPTVQAVFCIDVRSEVFRRALEAVAPSVQTLGFAGFFGLPIAYAPVGAAEARPRLPGLMAPTLSVTDAGPTEGLFESAVRARAAFLEARERWHALESTPASIFTFVESCGLFYLPALLRRSLASRRGAESLDEAGLSPALTAALRPRLAPASAHDTGALVTLAERVLRGMSLTRGFARLVLLVGHGSQSANNAHAAGLDCGACCGQAGDVNARVLAALVNEPAVRGGLRERGIDIPDSTWFLAALHNTTTDEVRISDADLLPASHAGDVERLGVDLAEAGHRARTERAPRLGIARGDTPERLLHRYQARANDWAQVRPEWGLAGNAALIVAPRARTRGLDLGGRVFLHEYDCRTDADGTVLTQIMTAPMVVANWINMQYFASVVDSRHFGSGNKLLHNVVGGRIGVFEGNGGDLRIGLPLQSVHDGQSWAHTPLRLQVYIEAPRAALDAVIAQHTLVRHLIEHRWVHLYRLDPATSCVEAMAHDPRS